MKFVPHSYQQRASDLVFKGDSLMLAMEMGLGKTVTTLTGVQQLLQSGRANNVLIVAPLRVCENVWPQEIDKWDHLDLSYSMVLGPPTRRVAALKKKADVYIINIDNLVWLINLLKKPEDWPFDTIILDESSKFKNQSSKRFRKLKSVRRFAMRVIELTGSPSPNSLLDLWSQVNLLDRGERLGTSFTRFKDRYFHATDYMRYNWEIKAGADTLIMEAIADVCISMRAVDYLDMPSISYNNVEVNLPPKAAKAYSDMEKHMIAALTEGVIEAANMAVVSGKCLQLSNGAVYVDEDHNWTTVHDLKLDALEEIVNEAGSGNLLIAYSFKHDLKRLKHRFPDIRTVDEVGAIEAWNRGEIKKLACHPASAGHGLNLQSGGSTVVWFGLPWSLELYEQLNARLHRQGQTKPVMVHHIMTRGTLDFDVLDRLSGKRTMQEIVKDFLRRKT